jgi:hypothetical protein
VTVAGPPSPLNLDLNLANGHAVVDVSCAQQHVLVLTSSGVVFSMGGLNMLGELGVGDYEPRNILTRVMLDKQISRYYQIMTISIRFSKLQSLNIQALPPAIMGVCYSMYKGHYMAAEWSIMVVQLLALIPVFLQFQQGEDFQLDDHFLLPHSIQEWKMFVLPL